ncbi:MAG: hypothetical protein R2911_25425 [Caldilineaceae bacterium]
MGGQGRTDFAAQLSGQRAGYGEAFRELNVRNLGVGDVTSSPDYLICAGLGGWHG